MLTKLKISHTPLSVAFRSIEPTWRNYIYYANQAAQSGDEGMKKFIAVYEALPPRERSTVMPDQLCDLADISPGDLIAAVAKETWNHKQSESLITASVLHPKVVEHTGKYAAHALGNKDRELFFRMTGTLPDKKGASIVINNNPQTAHFNPSPAGANGFRPMAQRVIEMGKFLDEPGESLAVPFLDPEQGSEQDLEQEPDGVFAAEDESED